MLKITIGVFIVLHGLVHLLYFGQSRRLFELQAGMVWPDGSWAFTNLLGDEPVRRLASMALLLAAAGFVAGGAGLFLEQDWWRPVAIGAAVFSSVLYLVFWDGHGQNLDDKGGVGVLINLVLLAFLLIYQWR